MPDDLAHILSLAKHAIAMESSPIWKTDAEEAMRLHGEACEAVWAELKRQVQMAGQDVPPPPPSPTKQVEMMRKKALRRLKGRLPELIAEAIGEIS